VTVVRLDPEGHAKVQALLPWYVTGRLDAVEHAEVEAHLEGCARCRAELALERKLHATQAAPAGAAGATDVDRAWTSMRRRIDGAAAPVGWWRWAFGLQFVVIAAMATALLWPPQPAGERYRGLGAPGNGANAVIAFHPQATEAQIRAALRAGDARLVGGPTATHAYLLTVPIADDATLARLREQPGVALAEALTAAERAP